MKIDVIICPNCGDKIFSRAQYDYRKCTCKEIMVDGGHWDFNTNKILFERYGGKNIKDIKIETLDLDVTTQELYNDWNNNKNKFGVIKCKKLEELTKSVK